MSLTALTTSILVILLGQANQPESNIVKDIKRKISIAILLLIPNAATLGSGLMIALTIVSHRDSITSWNAWILGIGLLVSFGCFCVYWVTLARTDLLCMLNWGTEWTMVSYLKKINKD